MYYYYFNLHVMHAFFTFISVYSKTKMERIIKKKYFYIFIYNINIFFMCRNKNTRIKILSNDIVFVYELCDPSNPSHLTYTLSPFRRSTFSTRYTSRVARCSKTR